MNSHNRKEVTSTVVTTRNVKLKHHRIRKQQDYQLLRDTGRRLFVNDWLLINYKPSQEGSWKFGWTVPKAVGGSVQRNRFKRWIRESFQKELKEPVDHSASAYSIQVVLYGKKKAALEVMSAQSFKSSIQLGLTKLKNLGEQK